MSNRPVRVLHVIDGLAGGGAERWVYDIVRLTPRNSVEHCVVPVFPDLGDFVYASRLAELQAYDVRVAAGTAVRSLEAKVRNLANSQQAVLLRRALALLLRLARPASAVQRTMSEVIRFAPDIIHGHSFQGLVVALVASRLSGRPIVHTVPALFDQMRDAGFGWMPGIYKRARWIDCFFAGASLAELREVGIPMERVVWIEGAVDLERVLLERTHESRHRSDVRVVLSIPPDAPLGLSVGRLHPSKGHAFALEALPSVLQKEPTFHWLVVGDGEGRELLMQRARSLGLERHMHLVGFHNDPLPFYAASDLYLRPHLIEGENLSSFTAMAFGLPVVGFDTGAENELISNVGHGLLVPNRDTGAFGAAVTSLLTEEDRGAARGARGAVYSSHHFDLRAAVDKFVAVYRRLARARLSKSHALSSSDPIGEQRA
jgi:glycosyltransferase involved in cell wall biosynthesis